MHENGVVDGKKKMVFKYIEIIVLSIWNLIEWNFNVITSAWFIMSFIVIEFCEILEPIIN